MEGTDRLRCTVVPLLPMALRGEVSMLLHSTPLFHLRSPGALNPVRPDHKPHLATRQRDSYCHFDSTPPMRVIGGMSTPIAHLSAASSSPCLPGRLHLLLSIPIGRSAYEIAVAHGIGLLFSTR